MKKLLKLSEVVEYLNVSEITVRRLIDRGKISFYKIGKSLRFREEDIEKYLEDNRFDVLK